MKASKILLGTLREAPAEATNDVESYKLMLRGGIIRKEDQGVYSLLPLGMKAIENLENHFKEKVSFLGYEESQTSIKGLSIDIKTYKQLPIGLYSTSVGRVEEKPKYGLLKAKEYRKLHGFKINSSKEDLELSYGQIKENFINILQEINIPVECITGSCLHEGSKEEIVVRTSIGDKDMVSCPKCGYKANINVAKYRIKESKEDLKGIKRTYTENVRTIKDLEKFFNISSEKIAKTLIYSWEGKIIAILLRGDRDLNEDKLKKYLVSEHIAMANEEEVFSATGAEMGFAGPVSIKVDRILVDEEVSMMRNFIVGANATDYHLENVNFNRDFKGEIGDFKNPCEGDLCYICEEKLETYKYIQIGTLSKISQDNSLSYSDENGELKHPSILKYSLGTSRVLALTAEYNKDDNGIIWPKYISPYKVIIVVAVSKNKEQQDKALELYNTIKELGVEVLLDDRDDRAGVKFKDCDLIGSPIRITVGKKITEGMVEYKERSNSDFELISIEEAINKIKIL
ncbi:YbaK/EbsC family protein [Clostridium hydrogeniformans]|uniref:YbaK/EbsC family protein n=1 Tax=Clostridium hydrogeniformans TaxID=349933 RepID=UPI0004827236|nr:YbaK/EbsC family protein [Clostridium hydrogeniformans]